jgi:hypothetical protein
VLIDKALEVDPGFSFGLVARGRYHMQTGEMDEGIKDLLAGSAANPAYAQGQLILGAGYYESGDKDPAEQSIENADRLDPNDPVTTNFETAIAIDDYDSDRAIASAQETLKRGRARGGDYASLSANREEGSLVNEAFRLQGLDAWGRYYGDAMFDPFSATGYVDQSLAGSVNSFVVDLLPNGSVLTDPQANTSSFSSLFQGLMLDPLMLSGRSRTANLFRRPFIEGSFGSGFTNNGADEWEPTWSGELQGYQSTPIPWSFYANVTTDKVEDFRSETTAGVPVPTAQFDLQFETLEGIGYLTAKPTPYDRVVLFANATKNQPDLLGGIFLSVPPVPGIPFGPPGFTATLLGTTYDRTVEEKSAIGGVGWSHTIGYRNVVNAAVFVNDFDRQSNEDAVLGLNTPIGLFGGEAVVDTDLEQRGWVGAVNHAYGIGDLTLRYGAEGGTQDISSVTTTTNSLILPAVFGIPPIPLGTTTDSSDVNLTVGRAYIDALYEITPDLKVEAAAFGTRLDGDGISTDRFEPKVGIAWTPSDGQWLRAGFMRESAGFGTPTLSPVGVVGLQSNQVPLALTGYADTFIARWDAEWTSHLFTSVDYQHQELTDISITNPGLISTLDLTDARIDRVSATANVWLENGLGAFGTIAWADSENETPGFSGSVPFLPDWAGRVGLTWVNEANIKVTVAGTYVGERDGDFAGTDLDDFWTADAFLTWEPFNKRFELQLAGYNLFDRDFDLSPGVPGWGRSFAGSLKIRF